MSGITFVTYAQAAADVREWSRRLPEFDAVCGIPRSGTIIAAMLAEFRHCHLVEFADLAAGRQPWRTAHRRRIPAASGDRVLVVDDTSWTGRTIREAQAKLRFARAKVEFGALYFGPNCHSDVRHPGRALQVREHEFEWNLLRTCLSKRWLVDMDGVLCVDWPHGKRETGINTAEYEQHIRNVPPLYRPCYPVRGIVTARVERRRPETQDWLDRHGIAGPLTMFNGDIPARERYGHARYKADHYAADAGATLFVESSLRQSREIAERTGKPVLSIEGLRLFNGTLLGEW